MASRQTIGSIKARRNFSVFSAWSSSRFPTRWSCCRIRTSPLSRSTSSHRRPVVSPSRRPHASATEKSAPSRCLPATFRNAAAWSTVSGSMALSKGCSTRNYRVLATQVEEAHGADAVSRALERAYAAVVRQHRTRGAVRDSSETLRAAVRRPFKVSPLIYIVFPSGIGPISNRRRTSKISTRARIGAVKNC